MTEPFSGFFTFIFHSNLSFWASDFVAGFSFPFFISCHSLEHCICACCDSCNSSLGSLEDALPSTDILQLCKPLLCRLLFFIFCHLIFFYYDLDFSSFIFYFSLFFPVIIVSFIFLLLFYYYFYLFSFFIFF